MKNWTERMGKLVQDQERYRDDGEEARRVLQACLREAKRVKLRKRGCVQDSEKVNPQKEFARLITEIHPMETEQMKQDEIPAPKRNGHEPLLFFISKPRKEG